MNGISLTVVSVDSKSFSVSLIPETLENTNLKFLKKGDLLNIEADQQTVAIVETVKKLNPVSFDWKEKAEDGSTKSSVGFIAQEIETLFEQVLLICQEQGLLGNELFAIDGCKMSSNSAKEWSGTLKELEEKRAKIKRLIGHHVSEHKKIDGSDTLDEQRKLRAEQAIETLNKAHDKIDNFLKMQPQGWGKEKGQKK